VTAELTVCHIAAVARTAAILTARLRLRPYRDDDVDALWRMWTDPDVRRYLWDDKVISRATAEETMRESIASTAANGFGHWALTWRDSEELIGFCGLRRREEAPGEVELIYGLQPALWGRGLIAEAARAWLRFAFERLQRPRVWALTDAPNARSQAVMRRLGMQFDQRLLHNGLDSVRYVIRRDGYVAPDELYEVIE
jgi:RimJ/RimL family protein N-acetyltransferase